jgi:hypothetical protein
MQKKDFYKRLFDYYGKVAAVLKGEAATASIFPNTTDVGMSREKVYAEFLRLHLPSSCNVVFGGFLFGESGDESKQVDIIVTNDICPRFDFHNSDGSGKSFACIDGTLATISIKSNLNSAELIDALDNICSIPDKKPLGRRANPLIEILGYEDWPFKVIYASTGISSEQLLITLNDYLSKNKISIERRPNLIHISGKYSIFRVGPGGGFRNGKTLAPNSYYLIENADAYSLIYAISNIQQIASSARDVIFDYHDLQRNILGMTK